MHSPYTASPTDAFLAAQSAAGGAFTAVVWARPIRPWIASGLILASVWLVVLLPVLPDFLHGIGLLTPPDNIAHWLRGAAACATLAMLAASRHRLLVVPALIGQAVLAWLTSHVTESDLELEALHFMWFAALYAAYVLLDAPKHPAAGSAGRGGGGFRQDAALVCIAVVLASLVNFTVLEGGMDSSDEWANTYQAAIFAKFRAYAAAPPCPTAFQNYWIFSAYGRSFAQYTPGWPLFMAPFLGLGVVWLAGPVALGLLAAGVARLARRVSSATSSSDLPPSSRSTAAAGWIAGLAVVASNTLLINGASRYAHVFVAACFAWAIEAACAVATPSLTRRASVAWGVVLGLAAAFILSARPSDGGTLGLGLFAYFVYALARRRIALRSLVAATVAFAVLGGLSLVILRLQLGRWFSTGYSISTQFFDWNTFRVSIPKPNELKFGLPLATGAYCWWPLAPALGLAGLVTSLRSSERRVAFMLVTGTVALLTFYVFLEWGRGIDFGYGPRYQLAAVVPMAVGTGVLFAPLARTAARSPSRGSSLRAGGPAALAMAAAAIGVVRIAPLVYPFNHAELVKANMFFQALADAHLRNAVVIYHDYTTQLAGLNATENLPINLYPRQDVIIVGDRTPDVNRCVRNYLHDRRFYRYVGGVTKEGIVPDPG